MDVEIIKELGNLSPTVLVEMFIIDSTEIDNNLLPENERIIYIHNYVTREFSPIYFEGIRYNPVPCQFKNNELKGDGSQLPRPRFAITNHNGYASRILRSAEGMIGAKITRKRTFAKFLDAATWPVDRPQWNVPNLNCFLSEDIYYCNKKLAENKNIVEFELASLLEVGDIKIPRRKMFSNACSFDYRNSTGCGYDGAPVADITNKYFTVSTANGGYELVLNNRGEWNETAVYNEGDYVIVKSKSIKNEEGTDFRKFFYVCISNGATGPFTRPGLDKTHWVADNCSKKISGCLCRFPKTNLRFGGFPALARIDFA